VPLGRGGKVKKKVWYEDGKIQVNHTPYTIASPKIDVKSLNKDEKIVFMTALKRLLSIFSPNPVNLHTTVEAVLKNYKLILNEISDVKRGYKEIYNIPKKECKTKDLKEEDVLKIGKVSLEENITKPQPLFTENSIINVMKSKNIGTQATYKALIETISNEDRPYIEKRKNKYLVSTEFAKKFLSIIPDGAVNVLNEFDEEILQNLANKKISVTEARRKRNELIKKTFDIIKQSIDEKLDEIVSHLENQKKETLKSVAKCPKCGGDIIEKNNKYVCSNVKWVKENNKWINKGKCDFQIPKKISTEKIEYIITKKILKDLISKNKSKIDVLFKNKGKKFKKDIVLKENKVELVF
jgi:DNA topoisomerase-3